MKYIFDFDDTLFFTTKHRKEHMFPMLQKAGIPSNEIEEYYKKAREEQFSLKKLLNHFSKKGEIYEDIMSESKRFLNTELLDLIKKIGKINCYIITYGDEEFQRDKIKRADISSLFSEIIVIPESKKGAIEKICLKHKDEQVIFIDNKIEYFNDLDFVKYPNLKTILYNGQSIKNLII